MNIEPLNAEVWFDAIMKLQQRRKMASAADLGRQLRHAYHLQQLTPLPLRALIRPTCDEETYEGFLERGAYERAAGALVGLPLSYTARVIDKHWAEAAVGLPGDTPPILLRAPNRSSAVLGAWLCCLEKLKVSTLAKVNQLGRPATRKVSEGLPAQVMH